MNFTNIIIAICSMLFISIGADKFLSFLAPPCSLQGEIPTAIWQLIGVMQIGAGIMIWFPKFRKYVAGFFFVFMIAFSVVHLTQSTYDIGGSIFMAILLGLLVLNPPFIQGKKR